MTEWLRALILVAGWSVGLILLRLAWDIYRGNIEPLPKRKWLGVKNGHWIGGPND